MAQSACLLRFRARLKSRGYSNVRIFRAKNLAGDLAFDESGYELWLVKCIEPLLGYEATFTANEMQMNNWPGICFEKFGFFAKQIDFLEDGDIFI